MSDRIDTLLNQRDILSNAQQLLPILLSQTKEIQNIPLTTQIDQIPAVLSKISMVDDKSIKNDNHAYSSKLSIYSKLGHIIQKYAKGTKTIILPKSVNMSSIIIIGFDGLIIPFSYIPEANMGIALTDRSTGEKVETTVIKNGKALNGKILSLDPDHALIITDGKIVNIRKYDSISVDINDDYTRPRLIINNDDKPFTISYLLSGISWNCIGTALIDNSNNIMYLRLAANIINNTDSDINADISLISGEINKINKVMKQNYATAATRSFAPVPVSETNVNSSIIEDYVKYNVGNRIIHTKDVAELNSLQFPLIKIYIHKTNEPNRVRFGYRFTATDFIPRCDINVYSINTNGNELILDSFVGSDTIKESQKSDDVDIILGDSTMLQCKSSISAYSAIIDNESDAKKYGLKWNNSYNNDNNRLRILTENLTVDFTNHNKTKSSVILQHYIGDNYILQVNCQDFNVKKNGYIQWYFDVEPKEDGEPRKDHFSCQIISLINYY